MIVSSIDDFDRIARLNRVLAGVVDKRLHLVAEALYLGYPHFTDSTDIPTAAVAVTKDGHIRYAWNRKFFDKASDYAIQYIALHEALHIVLQHPQRRLDREPGMWNLAIDIAVNEVLDDLLPKANIMDIYTINDDEILKGRLQTNFKGIYTNNEAAETIYDKLMVKRKQEQQAALKKAMQMQGQGDGQPQPGDGDSDGDEKGDGKGSGDKKDDEKKQETLDSHDGWDTAIDPQTQVELDGIVNELKEHEERLEESKNYLGKRRRGRKAGQGSSHLVCELKEVNKVPVVPWQRLLRNRLASVHKPNDSENWARPHRKLYKWYPNLLLPGPHETETLTSSIFVSIDTSGSMDDELIGELVGIIKSLPEDQYEIHITWFDTSVYEATDLTKPQGRGGTSFNCVESVITGEAEMYAEGYDYYSRHNAKISEKKVTRYPDIVILMTDGENFGVPHLLHEDRWIFIITKDGTDEYIKNLNSTIYKL